MMLLLLFALISSALFFLGSRAMLTQPIWKHYPKWLAGFMDCAACVGTWWGFLLGAGFGHYYDQAILGLPPHQWMTVVWSGLAMQVLTPIVAGAMQRGLDSLGTIE